MDTIRYVRSTASIPGPKTRCFIDRETEKAFVYYREGKVFTLENQLGERVDGIYRSVAV